MSATAIYARSFVSLVKLEHTVFALPYAYAGAILALNGVPSASQVLWITVAMAGARSLAMALEPPDRRLHRRPQSRAPPGARSRPACSSRASVPAFAFGSLIVFLVAVSQLAPLTRVAVADPGSGLRHLPLPEAVHVAVPPLPGPGRRPRSGGRLGRGRPNHVAGTSFLLGGAVALWIGGFDIIYATMDLEIDRQQGLHSIPLRFGIKNALLITRVAHFCSVVLLVWLGVACGLGPLYYLGVVVVAGLLAYENSIVSADDLSRVDMAFLTMNGVIALVFLAGVLADAIA